MNRYLTLIKKHAQRAYLRVRIVARRPDLIGKPFIVQLRTYSMEAIEGYIQLREVLADPNPDAFLPDLVYEAMEVEADRSAGYYRAQAELYKRLYWECFTEKALVTADHGLAISEANGYREVAAQAIEQLNEVKFSTNRNN